MTVAGLSGQYNNVVNKLKKFTGLPVSHDTSNLTGIKPSSTSISTLDRLFSLGKPNTTQPDASPKDEHRALPALWYRSQSLFSLERRAIFSKKWMVITHQVRYQNVGDYVQYNLAEYSVFVIKDRKGCLRAFHNVCRHRAYPLMEGGCGAARIIACKYHGMPICFARGNVVFLAGYRD